MIHRVSRSTNQVTRKSRRSPKKIERVSETVRGKTKDRKVVGTKTRLRFPLTKVDTTVSLTDGKRRRRKSTKATKGKSRRAMTVGKSINLNLPTQSRDRITITSISNRP